jgi:cysteinyl-tRNA synthetase
LKLFNTLSETEVEIQPEGEFRMFVCGPTVQDNVHLGHAKTYLAFDVLARWLLKTGRKVFFLLNITDIDDKIFDRAKKENVSYGEIADKFYNAFLEDLEALNILTISRFARVSKYVDESAELVKTLLDRSKAYRLDGSVYFDTSKADHFGKLSHQNAYSLRLKQIDAAPGKKNAVDFLLWRAIPDATEGIWQTVVGPGRPGWHIQDSAIAFREIGGPYDLHGGATELIFPHHESELAQDEAISGTIPFVKVWMHTGLLFKGQEKMSKSLGNVVTIREALDKFANPDQIRFFFLKHHYRDAFEFSSTAFQSSKEEFKVIEAAAREVPRSSIGNSDPRPRSKSGEKIFKEFSAAMDNNLDTPVAISTLVDVAKRMLEAKESSTKTDLGTVFWEMAETLGFRIS